jgi:hypothetical protein
VPQPFPLCTVRGRPVAGVIPAKRGYPIPECFFTDPELTGDHTDRT